MKIAKIEISARTKIKMNFNYYTMAKIAHLHNEYI